MLIEFEFNDFRVDFLFLHKLKKTHIFEILKLKRELTILIY